MLDIKIPIGLMFLILGILLGIFGLATIGNEDMYKVSLSVNINLWSGLGMVLFGVFMLLPSLLKPKKKTE